MWFLPECSLVLRFCDVATYPTENGAPETCMFQHISCMNTGFMYDACMDDAWCASIMHVTCIVKKSYALNMYEARIPFVKHA